MSLFSQIHITINLILNVWSNLSHVTPYFNFILSWNRWNVWFGMKEGSEPPGCITYLISFSSEYTWVLFNGPNGHWVTPGQPSNTLFKSHNTQAQDLWTRRCLLIILLYNIIFFGGGSCHRGAEAASTSTSYVRPVTHHNVLYSPQLDGHGQFQLF